MDEIKPPPRHRGTWPPELHGEIQAALQPITDSGEMVGNQMRLAIRFAMLAVIGKNKVFFPGDGWDVEVASDKTDPGKIDIVLWAPGLHPEEAAARERMVEAGLIAPEGYEPPAEDLNDDARKLGESSAAIPIERKNAIIEAFGQHWAGGVALDNTTALDPLQTLSADECGWIALALLFLSSQPPPSRTAAEKE